MKANKVNASTADLLNPGHAQWAGAEQVSVNMQTPPIGNVPSNYFRALDSTKIGVVKEMEVSALHNGESLFFRLTWQDPNKDDGMTSPGAFRDGAGVLFPFLDTARINNMGSKKEPVNAWCWQAGIDQPRNVTAAGLGTTRREDRSFCAAGAEWAAGRWSVVISRPFSVAEADRNVALSPGMTKPVGFAVWEGSNMERAGAKSFCGKWHEVEIVS